MGVFLSKPSVTKFSEDGEDDDVGFGVSSMQGWRRGMEDAHVALLDVEQDAKAGGEGQEEGGGAVGKIRMFGVFDGHGGKEVALFVQEHMAEELTKLQEYRGGDFPGALIRVFHRMDELLEGAATELLRSRGMLPEEGGDVAFPGGGEGAKDWEGADATLDGASSSSSSSSSAAAAAAAASAVASSGDSEDGKVGGGVDERSAPVGDGDGVAGKDGEAGRPGGEGAEEGLSVERCREILNELSEFRSRKNPSDLEAESRSSRGDSRAVLCRGGVAVALSHDHKPMSVTEKTRIQRAGGFVNAAGRVNGNLNLSRSIGDLKYKANSSLPPADQMITAEPDVMSVEVTDEDRFMIMACDGVWDCMTSQKCVDFVGSRVGKMSLSKVCEEVMDACLSDDPRRTTGIGGDNMTCIVVLLDKSFSAEGLPSPAKRGEAEAEAEADGPGGPADEKNGLDGATEPECEEAKE
eukprot:g16523.t1